MMEASNDKELFLLFDLALGHAPAGFRFSRFQTHSSINTLSPETKMHRLPLLDRYVLPNGQQQSGEIHPVNFDLVQSGGNTEISSSGGLRKTEYTMTKKKAADKRAGNEGKTSGHTKSVTTVQQIKFVHPLFWSENMSKYPIAGGSGIVGNQTHSECSFM